MRTKSAMKNIIFGLLHQILYLSLNFSVRTIFIASLGITYLGINGLFSNIITLLSLADLGIGGAMTFSLYKPLKENNHEKLRVLMSFYTKIFRIISISILIIGISIIPILPYIIKGSTPIPDLEIIYILFVINSAVSYFVVYKRILLIADQKSYIISKLGMIVSVISSLTQILILIVFKNFILYTLVSIVFTIIQNIIIANKANKLYPFLISKTNQKLLVEEKNEIFKNTYSVFLYRICATIINGADSIIISSFIGIIYVGIYSNYIMVTSSVNKILNQIFNSLTASVGNLNVSETPEKKYQVFSTVFLVAFWLYGIATICLWQLFDPFISLWLGDQYRLDKLAVFAIAINFLINGIHSVNIIFRDSAGLYQLGKYRPVYAAIINVVTSIVLSRYLGVAGVLFGTIVCRLATFFWYDPYIIFRVLFKRSAKIYFLKYLSYIILLIIIGGIVGYFSSLFDKLNLLTFIYQLMISIIIPNAIFLLVFRNSKEFKILQDILVNFIKKPKKSLQEL
jgi:O-antigen/teichoic acid export membrane protein